MEQLVAQPAMNSAGPSRADRVDCFGEIPEVADEAENYYGIDLRPGQILDGRFRLGRVISHGGMASVFLAEDLRDRNQAVAIKAPHRRMETDPAFFSRFQREEHIGAGLDHPLILRFIPVAEKSRPYIVTEYLSGSTLWHLLATRKPLPEKDAFQIARVLCQGLQYLHSRGIVHRDLKPGNIMVCRDRTLRLMDFGLATQDDWRKITVQGFTPMLGTPEYMSPEQVLNKKTDVRTDIYGLGVILYEMLTGTVPFANENTWTAMNDRVTGDPTAPRALNPALSPQAEEIVLHCLRRNPDERYQCVDELMAELESPEKTEVTGLSSRLKKPHWRIGFHTTPLLAGLLMGIGILFLQGTVFLLLLHFSGRK